MMELEKTGMWKNICRRTITCYEKDDLQKDALAVYKVHSK